MKFYSALTNGPAPKPTLEGRISHGHTAVRPARAAQCTSAPETITKYDAIWTGSTGTIKLFSGAACKATERQHLFYLQHLTSFSQSENHSGGHDRIFSSPLRRLHQTGVASEKMHCLEIATRPQRSPDPGPWHDVAHSLPAAVPSLNHSPASVLNCESQDQNSSSSVEFRFSADLKGR